MTTGGHPPPEYAQKSLYVQQPSLRAGVFMVHQHYGTQTVRRDHFRLLRYKARLGISRPFCYPKSPESTAAG